jgi:hypothetical protein
MVDVDADGDRVRPHVPTEMTIQWTLERRAAHARARTLARARKERWPSSAREGPLLDGYGAVTETQQADRMRAEGKLLGLWSPTDKAFYYPPFQFTADGCVHPRLAELLAALADIPIYAPVDDPTGWGRFDWCAQPRGVLS